MKHASYERVLPSIDAAAEAHAAAIARKLKEKEPMPAPKKSATPRIQELRASKSEAVDVSFVDSNGGQPSTHKQDTDEAALAVEKAKKFGVCDYAGGQFGLKTDGVYFFPTQDKNGDEKAPVWVCSRIEVIAKTRDPQSGEWGRLLEWLDDDKVPHQWAMPLDLLEGDGTDFRRELARLGLRISPSRGARDLLAAFVKVWPVDKRARCVDRLGWHESVYVTPTETIGAADELVVFQNEHASRPAWKVAGTADAWRESVGRLCTGNSRLVFAVSASFAGSLLALASEDNGGFHIRGKSSSGKSTALKASSSVWGEPSKYVHGWRATANGLEGQALLHNDGVLILDELSQADPKEAGQAAYMISNGQGKARAQRNGSARPSKRWRTLFMSAGEVSLTTLMAQAGRKPNTGQEIRMADFDADAGVGLGAFENLNGHASGEAFSDAVKDAAALNHGAVGIAWLRHIVNNRPMLDGVIADGLKQFVAEVVPNGAAGQAARVARRFALVAVAGELATHYGLTGWVKGEAERGAKACFKSWLDGFGGGFGNKEELDVLAQVSAFFEAHGAARFEDVSSTDDKRIINRVGFFRNDLSGDREYLVMPEAFKSEVCSGRDWKAAEKLLVAKGWIEPGSDKRPTQKLRIKAMGATARVYVFNSKMMGREELEPKESGGEK